MSGRFLHRARLALAGMALCGGISGVTVAVTGGTAYASTAYAVELGQIYNDYSNLVLDVGQNGVMIQDQLDGSTTQLWSTPAPGSSGRFKNWSYNLCVTTNGVEGEQLYLKPCSRSLVEYQTWDVQQEAPGLLFSNPYSGLVVDVYGCSNAPGAAIDGWPYHGGSNRFFNFGS